MSDKSGPFSLPVIANRKDIKTSFFLKSEPVSILLTQSFQIDESNSSEGKQSIAFFIIVLFFIATGA